MSTQNLPTKKEFQELADKLKKEDSITRCQANEKLAKDYGFKNYGAIKDLLDNKPVTPVSTFQTISMEEFKEMEKQNVFSNASLHSKYFKKYNTFENQQHIIDGIAYNPKLSNDFYCIPNQDRDVEELNNWWDVSYIVSHTYNNQVSYILYCLDGGAWDRPTRKGDYNDFQDALNNAQALNNIESKELNRYRTLKNGSVVNPSGLFISITGERTTAPISKNSLKLNNIEKAKYFIESIMEKRKTINKTKGTTYTLKHRVEEFIYHYFENKDAYLTNGEFIIALDQLDYELKEINDDYTGKSINMYTNYKTLSNFSQRLENDEFRIYCDGFLDILEK